MSSSPRKRRPGYKWPGVHDVRQTNQPFKVDRLGADVAAAICEAHERGNTWRQISAELRSRWSVEVSAQALARWFYVSRARRRAAVPCPKCGSEMPIILLA